MNLRLEKCMAANPIATPLQLAELLCAPRRFTLVQLDLQLLTKEMARLGEAHVIAHHLSRDEQEHVGRFSFAKRKLEWLGGRFAAKYAAAWLLLPDGALTEIAGNWSGFTISADANGRPFLAAGKDTVAGSPFPDISISHSGSMAVAMAIGRGLCGVDIQKVTPKVAKVRSRFCTPEEMLLLPGGPPMQTAALTTLWAAKEALRKGSGLSSLPGFMELKFVGVSNTPATEKTGPWCFVFHWKHPAKHGQLAIEKCLVAVALAGDYALALTARADTAG